MTEGGRLSLCSTTLAYASITPHIKAKCDDTCIPTMEPPPQRDHVLSALHHSHGSDVLEPRAGKMLPPSLSLSLSLADEGGCT